MYGFFSDAALTTVAGEQVFAQAAPDPVAVDRVVYFGYDVSGKKAHAVTVSVIDAAAGSGSPATDVRLATTAGGLADAVPGAALSLGDVFGGVAGAVAVHVRVLDSTHSIGAHSDLSLRASFTEVDA